MKLDSKVIGVLVGLALLLFMSNLNNNTATESQTIGTYAILAEDSGLETFSISTQAVPSSVEFGKIKGKVSMLEKDSVKLAAQFTQTTTIPLKDYPLGYEMAKVKVIVNRVTCKDLPVKVSWYYGSSLIVSSTMVLKPRSCYVGQYFSMVLGHTGKGGKCKSGQQYIDGKCYNFAFGQSGNEIEKTGSYKVVVEYTGFKQTINFKVT